MVVVSRTVQLQNMVAIDAFSPLGLLYSWFIFATTTILDMHIDHSQSHRQSCDLRHSSLLTEAPLLVVWLVALH